MELKELDLQERVLLAALVKFTVMSDGVVSENEACEIDAIVSELGEAAYQEALDVAREKITDRKSLLLAVDSITRSEARELIYGTVIQLAIPESIDPREGEILDLLTAAWDLTVEFEGGAPEE